MTRLTTRLILLGLFGLATGCGGPQFADVEGTVTKDGTPLDNVRVEFWPEGDGPKSSGVTDAQGRYSLKTEDGQTVGAIVGPHRVVVRDLNQFGDVFLGRKAEDMPTLNAKAKQRFSKAYSDATQTDLKKTVTAGEKNTFDFQVK